MKLDAVQGKLRDSSYLPLKWHPWREELLPEPWAFGMSCASRVKPSLGFTARVVLVLVRDPLSSRRIHPRWVSDQTFPTSRRLCHLTSGSLQRPAHRRMCRPWTRGPASVCSWASSVVAKDVPSRAVARLWLWFCSSLALSLESRKYNIWASAICDIESMTKGSSQVGGNGLIMDLKPIELHWYRGSGCGHGLLSPRDPLLADSC